jgi:hypothetical protein
MNDTNDELDDLMNKLRGENTHNDRDYSTIDPDCSAAIRELINTYDRRKSSPTLPDGEDPRTPKTLHTWARRLAVCARRRDLLTATSDEITRDLAAMSDGSHPYTRDGGIKDSSVHAYASSLRVFFKHYNDTIEPDEIPIR